MTVGVEVLLLASGFYTLIAVGLFMLSFHNKNMIKANDKVYREELRTMRKEIFGIKGVVKQELHDFLSKKNNI